MTPPSFRPFQATRISGTFVATLIVALLLARPVSATTHIVEARNVFYSPDNLTIGLGDTVRFVWIEGTHPTASLTGAWTTFPLDMANPSYDLVLSATGTYPYECIIHNIFGMVGTIEVENSTPACDPAMAPSGIVSTAGVSNVSLSWTAIPGVDGYNLRGQSLGAPGFVNLITTSNSRSVGGLMPGSGYRWQVRARCAATDEITPFSPFDTFYTASSRELETPPVAPLVESLTDEKFTLRDLHYVGAAGNSYFEVTLDEPMRIRWRLIELNGRVLANETEDGQAGPVRQVLPLDGHLDGVYLLEVRTKTDQAVLRFFHSAR